MKKFSNIFIYILSLVASVITLGLNFFLARALQADAYGQIQYYVALATTCSQILLFGINSFVIREAMNPKRGPELINSCLSLFLCIAFLAFPVEYYILHNFVAQTEGNAWLTVSVILVASLMGINTLVTSYYQGRGRYGITVIFENLLPKLVMFILALVFFAIGHLLEFQAYYLIIYIGIYSLVAIPFCIKLLRRIEFRLNGADIKSMLFFFGVTVTYSMGNNLTKVLQGGLYQNNAALATISVSISICSIVKIFTSFMDNMAKPIFAKEQRAGNKDGLLDMFQLNMRMNSYIAIPLYLFFMIHSVPFLSLFGESYLAYPWIMTIIAAANFINDLTGPTGTMLAMTGKEKWELFNGILFFIVYGLCVFAFSFDSVYGLCFALLAAQTFVNLLKIGEVWYLYKRSPIGKKTLLSLLIIAIVNFAAIFPLRYISTLWIWFIVGGGVGVSLVALNLFGLSLYRRTDFTSFIRLKL